MKITILGCHGSDGVFDTVDGRRSCSTCGFLLNDSLLLDAGTAATALSLTEQSRISHVILSHLHFDHIKGLPALADNLSELVHEPITVAGIPDVIDGLRRHIFNSEVYPDFFSIPSCERPTLIAKSLKPGGTSCFSELEITPILVNHTVPTSGFIVRHKDSSFVYSGDTGATEELWHEARRTPHLKAAFIECSYPDAQTPLALASKHLTPSILAQEVKKLDLPDIALYVYHLKPAYKEQIVKELRALRISTLHVLEEGQTLTV